MRTESPGIAVDVVRAEASRFRHPLLLVHGLWTGGWIWRDFSAYLAHRGWDAWMPSFLETGEPPDPESRRRALSDLCRELPAAPVVVTHDAGLVLADLLAADLRLPAVVAIAPIVSLRPTLWRPRFWGAQLGARRLAPPRRRMAEPLTRGLAEADVERLRSDAGGLLRRVGSRARAAQVARIPGLLVAVDADPAAALGDSRRLAAERGWDLEIQAGPGRFPMLGGPAIGLADRVHRWLVQSLGADLLAWVDDDQCDS